MANNETILIKTDQNNLIHIDPNSVVKNGEVMGRVIKNEDLTMYVSLEAELTPRSNLTMDEEKPRLVTVGSGTFNTLKPNTVDNQFDTSWTDSFTSYKQSDDIFNRVDVSGQMFGINSININMRGAFTPQVTIDFVDVGGRTLFESAEDSPYKCFFHLPWPVFYLTVKGFYGKSIRYKLHMTSFKSSFDSSTGNFNSVGIFVGTSFAYLNDIQLGIIMNAPYLYSSEMVNKGETNTKNGVTENTVVSTSKGYEILKSVYEEMKGKNLIPKDFPVKTIKEMIVLAESIEEILEKKVFSEVVDVRLINGINDYSNSLDLYQEQVLKWGDAYIDQTNSIKENNKDYYTIKNKNASILGLTNGSLEYILVNNSNILNSSIVYNKELQNGKKIKYDTSLLGNINLNINDYIITRSEIVYVDYKGLVSSVEKIKSNFNTQKTKIEKEIEKKMNETFMSNDVLGFKPTIRNLFAIVLANAEVYVRLMKSIHEQAFKKTKERAKCLADKYHTDSTTDVIYPWVEISKDSVANNGKVLVYPGSKDVRNDLKTEDASLWPEIKFVEEYSTINKDLNKITPSNELVGSVNTYTDQNRERITNGLGLDSYTNKLGVPFLYELWDRVHYATSNQEFSKDIINQLIELEYDNIYTAGNEVNSVVSIIKGMFETDEPEIASLGLFERLKYTLRAFSVYDRAPYMLDNLYTTDYINEQINKPYAIGESITEKTFNVSSFDKLNQGVSKYQTSKLSRFKYPYGSGYFDGKTNYNIGKLFSIKNGDDFISTEKNMSLWVKDKNFINSKIKIGGERVSILNTNYFHKQLYLDFQKKTSRGKYVASAYLLLNSLPFKGLDDIFDKNVKVYQILQDLSAVHHIPYHLMLKWGSQYHRYKEKINNGVDILRSDRFDEITHGELFSDDKVGVYMLNFLSPTDKNGTSHVGAHPFYDTIFHQIVNGYSFYDVERGYENFNERVLNNNVKYESSNFGGDLNYMSGYVNNFRFDDKERFITLLPTNGGNKNTRKNLDGTVSTEVFNITHTNQYRIIWDDEYRVNGTGSVTPNKYNQHMVNVDGYIELSENNKSIDDLISIFNVGVLESFEELFLTFASDIDLSYGYELSGVKHDNFQKLLQDLVRVDIADDISAIKELQNKKITTINDEFLDESNLIRVELKNPREFSINITDNLVKNKLQFGKYNGPNHSEVELYIGNDDDGIYDEFFRLIGIEVNKKNVLLFKPYCLVYKGVKLNNRNYDYFVNILQESLNSDWGFEKRFKYFVEGIMRKLKNLNFKVIPETTTFNDNIGDDNMKLSLYKTFKIFNDKWTSGKSMDNGLMLEDFLFIDRRNQDIGDELYLNIGRFKNFKKNENITLLQALDLLIADSGITLDVLPAYVNFYGDFSNSQNIKTATQVGEELFGLHNEIDFLNTRPKTLVQYVGNESERNVDMGRNYQYKSDITDVSNPNNSLVVTSLKRMSKENMSKSNRVVSFEVGFGDSNQSMFKGFNISQDQFKNTVESAYMEDMIIKSQTSSGTVGVDSPLLPMYNTISYTCQVNSLGNVMIQPTMYFYLKNVPLFRGSYRITDVTHTITTAGFETNFTGVRVPMTALPDPTASLMTSYRSLFESVIKNKVSKQTTSTNNKEVGIVKNGVTYLIDVGETIYPNEKLVSDVGLTEQGIPYNGYYGAKHTQMITNLDNNKNYLRSKVIKVSSTEIKNSLPKVVSLINSLPESKNVLNSVGAHGLTWEELLKINNSEPFFIINVEGKSPETVLTYKTEFINPKNKMTLTLQPKYELDRSNGGKLKINGIADTKIPNENYGIVLSDELCRRLKINDGDVVYFKLS